MSWQINIPYRDRDDLVLEPIRAARETMSEDEARVVEVIANDALLNRGITTVGGLLDDLDGLDRAETRQRLDWAREEAGLVSATEVDRRREDARFERGLARLEPPPPPRWSPLQGCPSCGCYPTRDGGAWREVDCEQWWCEEHRAGHEDDMKPHELPYRISGTGRPIPSPKEAARIAEWAAQRDEKEQRERQRRKEDRERKGEALEAVRERYREQGEISILGVRCRPDGRIIQ